MKRKAEQSQISIAVVIPAYKVKSHILGVIESIGSEVQKIILVDDACPQETGKFVISQIRDPRVEVVFHSRNLGVGGAVKTGYKRSLELGAQITVKIDGDGQMDTTRIGELVKPILNGGADYTKGNRFFDVEAVREMPKIRIIGNLGLSFFTKLSSGYWRIFDPNNGFTAIASNQLRLIPMGKVDNRYFFESDMLFRLNLAGATVRDVPMPAIYEDEKSNLKVSRVLIEFPIKHARNLAKRIAYTYYLRDFNLASIELPLGLLLSLYGTGLGIKSWLTGLYSQQPTEPGTLILVALSILMGFQLVLAFFSFDMKDDKYQVNDRS